MRLVKNDSWVASTTRRTFTNLRRSHMRLLVVFLVAVGAVYL